IATAEISAGQEHDPLILHLPSLPASPYVVRGTRQPLYFGLSTTSDEVRHMLEITVSLNQPSEFIPGDEMRRFEQAGITITAWPFAPVTMTVTTEAGSRAWLVRCTADGTVRLRSSEIQLRDDLTWAEISCR